MKLFQYGIRIFVLLGSIASFLGGWPLLAHANKPIAAESSAPIAASTALPSIDLSAPSNLQPLPTLPRISQSARPRLRTRGS
jgi:hypothetical protein